MMKRPGGYAPPTAKLGQDQPKRHPSGLPTRQTVMLTTPATLLPHPARVPAYRRNRFPDPP
jgi:hypothetical protein